MEITRWPAIIFCIDNFTNNVLWARDLSALRLSMFLKLIVIVII